MSRAERCIALHCAALSGVEVSDVEMPRDRATAHAECRESIAKPGLGTSKYIRGDTAILNCESGNFCGRFAHRLGFSDRHYLTRFIRKELTMSEKGHSVSRRGFIGMSAAAAGAMYLNTGVKAGKFAGSRPNLVLILTDDQGYADLGCFGSKGFSTPRIDQMAAEGVTFTSFYTNGAVCSPTRASVMTGRYPGRTGIRGVVHAHEDGGLNLDEITLADALKPAGYATACIGKWHLGHAEEEQLPHRRGFDYWYGIPYSNNMNPSILMRNGEIIEEPVDQATLTKRYTDEAIDFVTENKDKPFFLYLPHTMPHSPLYATDEFRGTTEKGIYGDVMEEIDYHTGRLLDTLKELDLDGNTLVVFTSDNGGRECPEDSADCSDRADNTPFRDGKGSSFEGGSRVPFVVRWPGVIPEGKTTDEIAATMDFFPTFLGAAGAALPSDRVIDGHDILPLMKDPDNEESPHLAFRYTNSLRMGDWKLKPGQGYGKYELYNLAEDIGETTNLIDQEPEKFEELKSLSGEFRRALRDGNPVPQKAAVITKPLSAIRKAITGQSGSSRRYDLRGRTAATGDAPGLKVLKDGKRRVGFGGRHSNKH